MNTMKICSGCQKPLEANAPDGLCPQCLMKAGLGTGVDVGLDSQGESGRIPFVAPSLEEVARLFPQVEILGFIGQGGMGAVYKARQKSLERVVALKILPPGIGKDPAFAERFTCEAKALAKLNHPGIVTLYEFGRADGLFFFLMEFVDGVSLRHLLEVERVSAREALAIVPQICDALQYAHDQGIVHRDIKPENILLDRQGRVKVADFGLAKLVETDPARSILTPTPNGIKAPSLTGVGRIVGTPQYMAPEQCEHPTEVDHRADIYSLGVVFYQMLTGELPGKPIEAPSSKVQIDVRLDEVVLRALEKNPDLRYQQVSEVKTMVESISSSSSPVTGTAPSPARPAATRGRLRAALMVGVLVWLFVTGTITLITWIRPESWKVVAVISCPHSQPGRPMGEHFKHTATMIELIRSDVILGRVIDRLQLDERSGKLDERWGKRNLGLKLTKAQAMVLLKRRLDVRSEGGTLIQVGVFGKRPEEPEEAMDIANTIAEELRAFRIEQHESPAEMLEMTLRFTPPNLLLGLAAGFVLGLLAGGLVLWRGFLRRGAQASPVKTAVETIAMNAPSESGESVARPAGTPGRSLTALLNSLLHSSHSTRFSLAIAVFGALIVFGAIANLSFMFGIDKTGMLIYGAIVFAAGCVGLALTMGGTQAHPSASVWRWIVAAAGTVLLVAVVLIALVVRARESSHVRQQRLAAEQILRELTESRISEVHVGGQKAIIRAWLDDLHELRLFVGDESLGWSVPRSYGERSDQTRTNEVRFSGAGRELPSLAFTTATVEISEQIRLADGSLGRGLIFETSWVHHYIATAPEGDLPNGEVVFRPNSAITDENGTFTFADIRQTNGTLVPVSVRVRPASGRSPGGQSFGPVIETLIATADADDQGWGFFDLETGKSFKPPFPLTFQPNQGPAFVELTPELKEWIKARGVDLLLHLGETNWDMMTLGMQEEFAGQLKEWETSSPEEVVGLFAKKDADHLVRDEVPASSFGHSYRGEYDSVTAFRTRRNTMGVYQIQSMRNINRRGVGIRYKLVLGAFESVQSTGGEPRSELEWQLARVQKELINARKDLANQVTVLSDKKRQIDANPQSEQAKMDYFRAGNDLKAAQEQADLWSKQVEQLTVRLKETSSEQSSVASAVVRDDTGIPLGDELSGIDVDHPKPGTPIDDEKLRRLAWGPAAPNGLRAAGYFEPVREEYTDGDVVRQHVVFHNTGKEAVLFTIDFGEEDDRSIVIDQEGQNVPRERIDVSATTWIWPRTFYLQPGHVTDIACIYTGMGASSMVGGGISRTVFLAKSGTTCRVHWDLPLAETTRRENGKSVPIPGVWHGALTTGEVQFRVVESSALEGSLRQIAGTAAKTFGPVIDRVITTFDADDQGFVFFDLETGSSSKPPFPLTFHRNQGPAFVDLTSELKQWIELHDADFLLHLGERNWDLMTLEMRESLKTQRYEWDTSLPEEVMGVFAENDPDHLVRNEVPDARFGYSYQIRFGQLKAFRTRRNTRGIYQFRGLDNTTTRGVRLRYKLVREAGETAQSTGGDPRCRTFILRHMLASEMADDLRQILLGRFGMEARPAPDNMQLTVTAPPEVLNRVSTLVAVTDWPERIARGADCYYPRDNVEQAARSFFYACSIEDTEGVTLMLSPGVLAELNGTSLTAHGVLGEEKDAELVRQLRGNWPGKEESVKKVIQAWNRFPLRRLQTKVGFSISFGMRWFATAWFEGAPQDWVELSFIPDRTDGTDGPLMIDTLPPWLWLEEKEGGLVPFDAVPTWQGGYREKERWQDVGTKTPEAALQTLLWAAREQDIDRLGQMVSLPDDRREEWYRSYTNDMPHVFQRVKQCSGVTIEDVMYDGPVVAVIRIAISDTPANQVAVSKDIYMIQIGTEWKCDYQHDSLAAFKLREIRLLRESSSGYENK